MLSRSLQEAITENLKKKRQTILFLNRRGFSTFIMCRDCGYVAKCKNCNIALTYYQKENKLKCHYCGYEQNNITKCPECGSEKIRFFGTGTQKLEAMIKQQYPEATTIRMDIDTVTKKNSHEEILNTFQKDGIDILIGTQMVVKGHHFPNVTLVGVVAADNSLNIDDYRASERTFQLLTQVAGRAGRGSLPGKVILQTYNPDSYSVKASKKQDYDHFYAQEIEMRKQLKYPPFCDIIVMQISGSKQEEVAKVANEIHQLVASRIPEHLKETVQLYQAMPAPIDRIKNRYRYRIIMKAKKNEELIDYLQEVQNEYYTWKKDTIRFSMEINPNSML